MSVTGIHLLWLGRPASLVCGVLSVQRSRLPWQGGFLCIKSHNHWTSSTRERRTLPSPAPPSTLHKLLMQGEQSLQLIITEGKNWNGDMYLGERPETTMCFEKATNALRDWSRSGVFTVPVSGIYLLSLHLCSQDRKKVKHNLTLHSIYCFSIFYGKSIKHPTKAEKYLFFFSKWNRQKNEELSDYIFPFIP